VKTVWAVEQGEYSDYRVLGVFSTRENAERVATLMSCDWYEATVKEWPIDPGIDEMNAGYKQWTVTMDYDGTVEWCGEDPSPYDATLAELTVWRRSKYVNDVIGGNIWAKDAKHAIKIVNEKRLQWIADGTLKSAEEPTA